jgi:protoheme IX farnesyltransferase
MLYGLRNILVMIRLYLSAAVAFSAITGYLIARTDITPSVYLLSIGVFFLACGASVLNQIMERKQDALMERTRNRPIPSGKVQKNAAVLLASALLLTGFICLGVTGWIPALLGLINVLLYNIIYTRLKRVTKWAVIPGALVGAIPPLMGYTAAGISILNHEIIWFSAFMFLWQLPNFWLILMKYRSDYEMAGFKTFSMQVKNEQIKNLVFIWMLLTTAFICISMATGVLLKGVPAGLILSVNALFIAWFYHILFKSRTFSNIRNAYVLVNTFGLVIMLIFMINAMLF